LTACSTIEGLSSAEDDLFMLRRVHVAGREWLPEFMVRLRRGRALACSMWS